VHLSDAIVYWKIADKAGVWTVDFHSGKTQTQATCNGGVAERVNTYIKLDRMKTLPAPRVPEPSGDLTADAINWG
jgi:hypothetical protein